MNTREQGSPPPEDVAHFTILWDSFAGRVFSYACRHVDHHAAQEVVSETFLVAWRRIDDVPEQALPWLLVVARNTIKNRLRTARRHDALTDKMARIEQIASSALGADVTVTDRAELFAALATLTATEREAVLLTAWDGLSATEAARVAACSVPAMRVRLFRARRRLHADVDADLLNEVRQCDTTEPRSIR